MILVDGVETSKKEMEKINPKKMASINILKDQMAIKKHGVKGENGVIEITLKK
ncbi:hypothetical protein [Maribacter sp.]|uniref:hypothetical protein n=1 Tax=Maribacter sp. TaxID=1897614 RepID=UPI0025C24687|nr:hypothetical protein [Maribacter sp.]